jgi:hypothetical protein
MEFTVALDLSPQKCPSSMRRTVRGVVQCLGIYNTRWTDSEQLNWQWGSKHRLLSTVQVHYDPTGKSGSTVFFVGEPINDAYPWTDIAGCGFLLFLSFLCFMAARSNLRKAEQWESDSGDKADSPDGRDDSARSPAQGSADILQLKL